jgi:hypothetical protein
MEVILAASLVSVEQREMLPEDGKVTPEVVDVLGRTISTLVGAHYAAGRHAVSWNPDASVASGVYLVRLLVHGENGRIRYVQTRSLTLQK